MTKEKTEFRVAKTKEIEHLRSYLKEISPGPLAEVERVEQMLAQCWKELQITGDDAGLKPYKLLKRTEKLNWSPPFLKFNIERHGAVVRGSIYANVHSWQVDVDRGVAFIQGVSRRQVGKRSTALKVQPVAQEIADLILHRQSSDKLTWKNDRLVYLNIQQIIPATNPQTTLSRRKRFKVALEPLIARYGWNKTGPNKFEQQPDLGRDTDVISPK